MYSAYLRPLGSATRCSRRHPGGSAAVPFGDLPGDLPPPGAAAAAARDRISIAKSWSAVGGGLSGGATPAAAHSRAYRSLSCSAAATYSARSSAPMPFHRSASSFVTSAAFASGFAAATSGRVLSPKKMKAVRGFFGPLGAFASSVAGAAAGFAAAFAASAAAFASAFSARARSRSAFAASFSDLAFSRACRRRGCRQRIAHPENCAPRIARRELRAENCAAAAAAAHRVLHRLRLLPDVLGLLLVHLHRRLHLVVLEVLRVAVVVAHVEERLVARVGVGRRPLDDRAEEDALAALRLLVGEGDARVEEGVALGGPVDVLLGLRVGRPLLHLAARLAQRERPHLATSAFFFSGSFARIASPTKESSPSHGRTSFDVDRTLHDSPVPKKRTRTSPSSSFGARTLHGHHGKPISFAHTLSSRPKS